MNFILKYQDWLWLLLLLLLLLKSSNEVANSFERCELYDAVESAHGFLAQLDYYFFFVFFGQEYKRYSRNQLYFTCVK